MKWRSVLQVIVTVTDSNVHNNGVDQPALQLIYTSDIVKGQYILCKRLC